MVYNIKYTGEVALHWVAHLTVAMATGRWVVCGGVVYIGKANGCAGNGVSGHSRQNSPCRIENRT